MCNEIFNFSRLGSYMPYHLMITALKDENPEIFFFFFFWSKPDANIHLMQKIKSILALGCRNMSIVEVLYKNSIISLSVQPMMSFALCMLMAEYRRNMTVTQNSSSVWGQFLSSSNFYFLFLSPQEMECGIWYNACKLYPQTILSGSSAPAIKIC